MQTYYTFLTSSIHDGEWSISFISRPIYSCRKSPSHPLTVGGRQLSWTTEKWKTSASSWEHNPTILERSRTPNNVSKLSVFQRQLFWEPEIGRRIIASSTKSPAICISNTHQQPVRALCQFCSLTETYRDILLSHRCHWIICGWLDACYMMHIGKAENNIADYRNSTVSDGFYNFNQQMQTTVI